MTVYQSPFLFLTEESRWQAKLLIVPEATLHYQYFHNHCLQSILKWWQRNNGWSFQSGVWDAQAHSPLFLKRHVCTAGSTFYCQTLALFLQCLLYWSAWAAIKVGRGVLEMIRFYIIFGEMTLFLAKTWDHGCCEHFSSVPSQGKSPLGAAGWADAENELVWPTSLISTCQPPTSHWTFIL